MTLEINRDVAPGIKNPPTIPIQEEVNIFLKKNFGESWRADNNLFFAKFPKIEAIKKVRDQFKISLYEAKYFVDQYERTMGYY